MFNLVKVWLNLCIVSYNIQALCAPYFQDNSSQPGAHALNQFSSGQISEWNNEHVSHWLMGVEMEKYTPLFTELSINGPQLIALDTNKMKVSVFA